MNVWKHVGVACLLVGMIVGCGRAEAQSAPAVVVRDAWVREPAPSRDVTAVFAIVGNTGAVARRIVGVMCERAGKAELHEMKLAENGMMSMSPVSAIDVPAHGQVELKPGGLHVMLFGLKERPVAGSTLPVVLLLDDGSKVTASATVRQAEMR